MPICPKCESQGETLFSACPSGDGYFLVDDDEYYGYPNDPWLGRQLGDRFIVASILGQGSMGHVYKAYQAQVDRMVAMKIFKAENVRFSDELGPDTQDRFVQEARVLAKLSHPNCVTLFDFGYDQGEGFLYIAMEYVAGISLRRAVRRGLKFDAIVEVVRQVLMALREAHALEIVHRDLKPENIILSYRQTSDEQIVKVLDFGIAKLLRKEPSQRTQAGLLFGTPAYMSPEQCRGETDITAAADIYALGCLTFEMIAGHLPFDSDLPQEMVRQHQFEPVPDLLPRKGTKLPEGVVEFVKICLEKEPENRFAHAGAALKAFEEIVGGQVRTATFTQGISSGADDVLTRRVAVPKNRISGAELNPTGEFRRDELLGEANGPAPAAAEADQGVLHTSETLHGKKASGAKTSASGGFTAYASDRPGLVAAALLAVVLFLSLLAAVLILLLQG